MKRRILWLGLSWLIVAAFVLASCGPAVPGEQEEEEEEEEEPVVEPKPGEGMYFRLVTHGGDDPYWMVVAKGMEYAAAELGCTAVIDLAVDDLALQQKMFAEAVAGRVDGIALVINDDIVWDKPVADALAAGIPVFGIDVDDSKGAVGNPRLGYLGMDERIAGYLIGSRLFEEGRKKGIDFAEAFVVMPVEVPGATYGEQRSTGVRDAMEEFGIPEDAYEMLDASMDMAVAEARQTAYLIAHPETTFMIGMGGITTDRLMACLKGAGLQPGEVLAGGFDCTPGTLAGVREGYVTVTADSQQFLLGYFAVYFLYLNVKYGFTPDLVTGKGLVDGVEDLEIIEKFSPLLIR